jgi:hypothetical protein
MREGLLYPPGDVGRLVEAVDLLLRAPDLRAALAARALRKAQSELDADSSARALAAAIREAQGVTAPSEHVDQAA